MAVRSSYSRSSAVSRFTEKYTNIEEATIFNLPEYNKSNQKFDKVRYDAFLEFYNEVNSQLDSEIKNNDGEIMQVFPVDENNRVILEGVKNDYDEMYLKPIKQEELYSGKYPKFLEHMHRKSYKVYEKYEELLGLPKDSTGRPIRIEEQTDEQIFETLRLRIEGLKKCQTYKPENITPQEQDYYSIEYEREMKKYTDLSSNTSITMNEKVEQQCKNIFYNLDALNSYKNQKYDFELIKKFLSNPKEELYARTYLPESCFDSNNRIIFDKVYELLQNGDRNYRQFVFGFDSDEILKTVREIKPFLYEAGGMIYKDDYRDSCNQMVNWSLYLNMLYCRCGIANNIPLCPVRFILPTDIVPINKSINKSINKVKRNQIIKFQIRDKLPLIDLFDSTSSNNAEFLGIVSIKYYHNETKEIRIWYFFVFKNNDFTNSSRQNTITGVREEIILCNYRLRQINYFALFEKHNVTHYELLHYITLAKSKSPNRIYFYKPLKDDKNIFISRNPYLDSNPFLKDLELVRVQIELQNIPGDFHIIPKTNVIIRYDNFQNMLPMQQPLSQLEQVGGNNVIIPKTTINEEELYFSKLILSKHYIDFLQSIEIVERLGWYSDNSYDNYLSNDRDNIYDYLKVSYPFLLIDTRESMFKHKKINNKQKDILIIKYNPISTDFFRINELFEKYKLFDLINKKDDLLYVGSSLSLLEYVSYHKYNFNQITNIITLKQNYFANLLSDWEAYIKNISSIYKINNINYNDTIYNINSSQNTSTISRTNKLIFWSVDKVINGITKYNSYYNIPLYISGILFSLKHLVKTGTLIFNIESVVYKHTADIILIIANYFEKWDLFYPELHNRYKRSGTTAIFTNFKGITATDIKYLEDLLEKVKSIYPDEANSFNIINKDLRRDLHLWKTPIPIKPLKNIISFLDYDIKDKIYEPFRIFNDSRYMEQVIYLSKMINILSSPERDTYLSQKTPTLDQLTSSILYCKKWDIPYWEKYNTSKINNYISRNILSEMYGLQEPILYRFKTPFKTYIADKIIINPRLQSQHTHTKTLTNSKSHHILKTVHSRINSKSNYKQTKKLSNRDTIGSIFRDILSQKESKHSRHTKTKSARIQSSKTSKTSFRRSNISLLNPIFPSNNQLIQVGRLIDSRRDFSKPTDKQTWLYDQLKSQFRYYKGVGQSRNVPNLDTMVQERLGDYSISQAWLKMYEIITDCALVPTTQKGTFHSFHLCEAPGTFINALNNYIRTKTQYSNFEWYSQSLNPKIAKIKDTYNLIKRHPHRWDWGADNTGDITQVANISHYKKRVASREPINLITSDCGLEWGNPKYEFVAFASYVAILDILPKGGTMLYKILSPIDLPLLWNLIYITYTNFKEMYFFKPVQNAQSREFYIVAKDYLGTAPEVLNKLLDIVQRWSKLEQNGYKAKWVDEMDLFGDEYPEEFVAQVVNISEQLAHNYVNSIERIIYYVDNYNKMGDEYKSYVEKYIEEKNEDWVRRYRPKKLENKWIL